MRNAKATPWVLGTVFLSLVILGAAWMLVISPQMQLASTARADTEDARAQNVVHAQRLAVLKEQAADLETSKAELAAIQVQIPPEGGLPALLREFDQVAAASTVFVLSIAPGIPEAFLGVSEDPAAAAAPAAPVTGTGQTDGAETDPAALTPEPAPTGVEGFVVVPIDITVLGTYPNVVRFVDAVQRQMPRLILVTAFSVTVQDEADASGGRPATAKGDAEFAISGYVYVLRDGASEVSADPTDTAEQGGGTANS